MRYLIGRCEGKTGWIVAALLLLFIAVWVTVGAYQSHYISALRILGDSTTEALIGSPKEGRGDEWSTYLPLLKQAYLEGFPGQSGLAPYKEKLEWFIAIPHLDGSLIFLPNYLAYWLLPGGNAISFQGVYYNLLLVLSIFWLQRNLRVGAGIAIASALMLLFSHFYQVWWTSNFPALGASILPFSIMTSELRGRYRFPALSWSIGHMLFGQIYPPFYFSLAVALLPFIMAVKPELLRPRNLLLIAASAVVPCVVFVFYKIGYIESVSGTSYPGMRISTGGDASMSTLLGVLFPTYPATSSIEVGATLYELSVVGTCFTLLAIAVLPAVPWTRDVRRVALVALITLAVLAIYMLSGFPVWFAKASGFFVAPGRRIQFGFSVLVLMLSAFLVSRCDMAKVPKYVATVFALYALVSCFLTTRSDLAGQFTGFVIYPFAPLALVALSLVFWVLLSRKSNLGKLMIGTLLSGMTVLHVIVFGSFNPVMRGRDIMDPVDSQLVRDWKQLYQMNHQQPLAVVGNYGHLLRGEGLAALEAIHLANVDRKIYANVFPELDGQQIETFFNRFKGIAFDNLLADDDRGPTVFFPVRTHSVAFPNTYERGGAEGTGIAIPPSVLGVEELSPGMFRLVWKGLLLRPLNINGRLVLHGTCYVDSSWLTRFPVGDPLTLDGGASLRGLAGELRLRADSAAQAESCVRTMQVSSPDQPGRENLLVKAVVSPDAGGLAKSTWSGKACDLNIDPERKLRIGEVNTLAGYVISSEDNAAGGFQIVLRGAENYLLRASTGSLRKDVAEYFRNPNLAYAGFEVYSRLEGVAPGHYGVDFLMQNGRYFCSTGKAVEVIRGP